MLVSILIVLNIALMYSVPLMLGALGGVISENSGVVNIGIEGMMNLGAFTGAAVAFYTGSPWVGLIAGGMASGLLALLHAIASVTFKADQTISGVAINFIGPGVALFLCRRLFDGSTMTKPVTKIPTILGRMASKSTNPFIQNLNVEMTVPLAFLIVLLLWFVLYKTKWGLRIRSVGENPAAADTLGINVYLVKYVCVVISGVLAGLGGATMTLAVVNYYTQNVISGQGFIALAAVVFGKWKPQGAMGACLLFGFAQALVVAFGGSGSNIQIPSYLLSMLPYVLTLVVLVIFVRHNTAPEADGIPYFKGE